MCFCMILVLNFGFLNQLNQCSCNFNFDEIFRDWKYFDFFYLNQSLNIFKVKIGIGQLPNVLSSIF